MDLGVAVVLVLTTTALIRASPEELRDEARFSLLDAQLRQVDAATADVTWREATKTSPDVQLDARAALLGQARTAWLNSWCARLGRLQSTDRRAYLLCRGPRFTRQEARWLDRVWRDLASTYSAAALCRRRGGPCLRGEPDLERLMRRSRDPAELLWAWQGWRRAVGPPSEGPYAAMVALLNQGAVNNGYSDMGECWREELETPDLEGLVERLYAEVEPLYRLLHAVTRHRLRRFYGDGAVSERGPIPAHLLGNMWAQDWSALLDLLSPGPVLNLTSQLRTRNYSTWGMVRRAEDFYTSLGLEPMTATFWQKSQVERPESGEGSCHGTAANLFADGDYRMLLCAQVDEEDFYVVHHEMGHIEYYMAYRQQPVIFQDGANSAFQEAVGDAVMHGVLAPQHLQRLGLINDSLSSDAMDLTLLLRQALSKIPQLPFGLLVDKWRWGVFNGRVPPARYNSAWWELKRRYQGVEPPVPRSDDDFDPAAKFHIPDNTPYVRYFLSGILQVQIFKAMCEAAVLGGVDRGPLPMPLHRCDLYGSKEAGKKLRAMMALGRSRPWPEALKVLTGTTEYSTRPFLEYYAPVVEWLEKQVQAFDIPVGWD